MRAVRFHQFGGPEVVKVEDVPIPDVRTGEIRIRVTGATINRTDLNARAGLYGWPEREPLGYGLGMDVSGIVDAAGPGVNDFAPGDRVVGFSTAPQDRGAQAEFVVLSAAAVVPAPRNVDVIRAATLPLNGLTAVQALEHVEKTDHGTLVVTGAAGGLGMILVQLANAAGHHVIAWARDLRDEDMLLRLGADQVVTSKDQIPTHSADAVIDAAMLADTTIDVIRDGGAFITLRGQEPGLERDIRQVTVWVRGNREQLATLVSQVEDSTLLLPDATPVPLSEVAAAHVRYEAGPVRSRLVLTP